MNIRGRELPVILVIAVLVATTVFGARPLISYRALALGAEASDIGLIASSFALLALIGAIPVGRSTDRLGGRPVVIAGALICSLVCALLVVADSLALLAVAQAGLGIGQLLVVVGSQTLLTRAGATSRQAARVGLYTSAASLGHALGPALGTAAAGDALVMGAGSGIFAAGSLLAGGAAALSVALPSLQTGDSSSRQRRRASVRSLLSMPGMRTAIFTSVVVLASVDILIAFLPVYGTERSIAPATIGLIIGALSASQIASRLVIARLVRRWGERAVLMASMAAPAVVVPIMLLPLAPVALLAVTTVVGLAMGLAQPMTLILVASSSPPSSRGLAMSLRLVGNRLGQLTIPAAVGAVAGASGVGAVFVSVAALLGIGAVTAATDRRLSGEGLAPDKD